MRSLAASLAAAAALLLAAPAALHAQSATSDAPPPEVETAPPTATIPVQALPEAVEAKPVEQQVTTAPVQLDAVVVTGGKVGRKLSETAGSVAVVRARDIEAQGDTKLQEVVGHVANVVRAGSDREIAIRGVLQNGIAGEGETISVVLDGVALPQRAANFGGPLGVFDVEQIEVLRGAQSTNQGRNSLAGAVIVKTRDPRETYDGRARVERSTGRDYAIAGAGGGAIVPGWLSGRFAFEQRFFRNDIFNVTRGETDAGREDTENLRAKLLLAPKLLKDYRALLTLSQSNNEFGDNLHDSTRAERTETADERYSETYRGRVWGLQQGYEFSKAFRLDAITGYAPGKDFRFADFDRTEREGGSAIFDYREVNRSQELRGTVKTKRVKGVLGLYAARIEKFAFNETVDPIPAAGGAALLTGFQFSDQDTDTLAGFGEFDVRLPYRLTVTLGARYQTEDSRRRQVSQLDFSVTTAPVGVPVAVPIPDGASDVLSGIVSATVPPDYDVRGEKRFDVFLPKAGIAWQVLPSQRLALTAQRGYRSGGTSASFFGGTRSDYDPEFTQTVELAWRADFRRLRATVNANAFYTAWEDQQVLIGEEASFFTTTTNAGRSHLYGLELEGQAKPFRSVLLKGFEPVASLGLLRTRFDEFVNNGNDFAGNAFPFAPRVTGSLGTHYRLERFFAFASATYNGAYFGQASNVATSRVPSKTLVNARLGWRFDGLRVAAFVRNLGDDLNLQDRFTVGTTASPRTAKRYGEPRLFGVALEAEF